MDNQIEKKKSWINRNPKLTTLGVFVVLIILMTGSVDNKTDTITNVAPNQPQTSEDRLRALATDTNTTDIAYIGIEDQKADSDRPEGSRMPIVKFNITNFYSKSSFYRDTGELAAKVFQEVFISNKDVTDVIVWYYGETTDKYGNKSNGVMLSMAIDKATYQKVNWQNFDSATLCDFLKSEIVNSNTGTACATLVTIE